MADPSSAPDPATIAAAVAAAGSFLHRVLDVGGVRKRLKSVEAAVPELRASLDTMSARLTRREQRADTGSQRVASDPALGERTSALSSRLDEALRRLAVLEEQADERARWERTIAADVARLEGHLSARVRRARERESDG